MIEPIVVTLNEPQARWVAGIIKVADAMGDCPPEVLPLRARIVEALEIAERRERRMREAQDGAPR